MLTRIDLRGSQLPGVRELAGLLPRASTDVAGVEAVVRPVLEDVRTRVSSDPGSSQVCRMIIDWNA